MKRKVSVCAGVMAALVAVSAGAREQAAPAEAALPASMAADAPMRADAPVREDAPREEERIAFNFSVVPGLSTQGVAGDNVVNSVALGLVGTRSGRLDGVAAALGGTWVDRGVNGVQLSIAGNYAGGDVDGAQLATGLNLAGAGLSGLQSSVGLNLVRGAFSGAQLSTGVNLAGGGVRGLQAAVGLNVAASHMVGLQTATGVSYAGRIEGAQVSLVNVGGDVDGAQVGLVNVAGRARGLQLGLVNVAAHSEGAPIGLLSFVGNGQFHVQAWASDVAVTNVAVKLGGKYVYSLFTLGFQPGRDGTPRRFSTGFGIGGHIPGERFFIDLDAVGSSLHSERLFSHSEDLLTQLRVVGGWQVAPRFAIIAGVTGNTLIAREGARWDDLGTGSRVEWERLSGDTRVRVWPGVLLGIQI